MIKHLLISIILISIVGCNSESSKQLDKKEVIDEAKIHFEALINQNWDEYEKHTPPELFKLMGGLENVKNYVTTQWKESKENGILLKKVVIDSCANIIKYLKEYQTTLFTSFEYQTDSTTITIQSTLIAYTKDKGKHWYYLDTYTMPIDKIHTYFPNISKKLVILKKGVPIVTKKG